MMKKFLFLPLVFLLSLRVVADPAFSTKQVPVNRGGQADGTVSLRFYEDMPSVAYISVADFQQLVLPGTTIEVTKTGEGEYTLVRTVANAAKHYEAKVNTVAEQFASDEYMAFTNQMDLIQPGMDNVYLDGAPYIRYRSQELTPASASVTFDFKKYGIDLRGDDAAVYFPLATIADLYSDLYYHIAGYNGEKVIVVTDNQNSDIAKLEPQRAMDLLMSENRSKDMADFCYAELCFTVDRLFGMPGRSPLENDIRSEGLDKALDLVEIGPAIKKLLKSTSMKEYIFGMNCLQMLLHDGEHTNVMLDMRIYQALEEKEGDGSMAWMAGINQMRASYPELVGLFMQFLPTMNIPQEDILTKLRPTSGTYYKQGDTAYLLLDSFGPTNDAGWKTYYDGGCTGATPAIDNGFLGDLSVVLDALKQANDDPEVKNLVVDLSINYGGSLDVAMAMTALMGGQSHFFSENVLTGQRQIIYYDVDCNFDGVFDEKDKAVKYDLNFAVLTSWVTFSCGNLFPSLMKDMGFPVIGERSRGGACAVQNFITPEGFQYQLSSARARLTDNKWQNIDGGIEPTHVIDTSTGDYSTFYDLATISDILKGEEGTEMATTITARGLYTDGDVTLNVTKTNDGSIELYDAKRSIYTKNCATLIPLDELASQGKLFDYVKGAETGMTESDVMQDMNSITASSQQYDITAYVNSAKNASTPDGQLYAYRLKAITIEQMTQNGKSYMPAGDDQPLGSLMVKMSYIDRPWVQLFLGAETGATTSPFSLETNMISQQPVADAWSIIPREGVTFEIGATMEPGVSPDDDGVDAAHFTVNLIPASPASDGLPVGSTFTKAIDQDGLKMTVTYELTSSHLADIHWGMGRTYDFYKNVLGRDSYDNKGAAIYNMTYLPGGYMMWDSSFPNFFTQFVQFNALADKGYTPYMMLYGTGGFNYEYSIGTHPMTELSVLCHEFTHLVTKCTANLPSNGGEGNALNESFSDIMAISMMKTSDYGYGPDTPWVIGGNGLIIGQDYMRNLADPKATNYPDTYEGDNWNTYDVYNMSAVQSYFYYLLCNGGKGTNDNGLDYDIAGIGVEKGTQIAYLTLTRFCTPESSYSTIRNSWLKAAQTLYGETSTEAQTVAKAWTAVGIDGPDSVGIDEIVNSESSNSKSSNSNYYTLDGRRLTAQPTDKGLYIHNGKVRLITLSR